MSFSSEEIFDSMCDDISRPTNSHCKFLRRDTGKMDVGVIKRTGRGFPDFTPQWRTRGRSTSERKKLSKVTRSLFAIALEEEASRL